MGNHILIYRALLLQPNIRVYRNIRHERRERFEQANHLEGPRHRSRSSFDRMKCVELTTQRLYCGINSDERLSRRCSAAGVEGESVAAETGINGLTEVLKMMAGQVWNTDATLYNCLIYLFPGVQMTERTQFNQRVYQIVEGIPSGQVLNYGRIAAFIPPPSGMPYDSYCAVRARWVGYAMASCPEGLPWHRVVNAQGGVSKRPGFGPDLQRQLLEDEGVVFDEKGRLDIQRYVWRPDPAWLQSRGLLPPPKE